MIFPGGEFCNSVSYLFFIVKRFTVGNLRDFKTAAIGRRKWFLFCFGFEKSEKITESGRNGNLIFDLLRRFPDK